MPRVQKLPAVPFIPCVAAALPPDRAIVAAASAVEINPANAPPAEAFRRAIAASVYALVGPSSLPPLTPGHLAAATKRYWGPKGAKLTYGFDEPTSVEMRNKIGKYANLWSKTGNVEFVWSASSPQIRITFAGDGYWSYLGTDILQIPAGQPTMCLQGFTVRTPDAEWERVVPHEFGHTLGFVHEHLREELIRRLSREKTIAYMKRRYGWDSATTIAQVLTPVTEQSLMGTPTADQESVMCYTLPGECTVDGRPIIGGKAIDSIDENFIARIYPKDGVVQPPTGSATEIIITRAGRYVLQPD